MSQYRRTLSRARKNRQYVYQYSIVNNVYDFIFIFIFFSQNVIRILQIPTAIFISVLRSEARIDLMYGRRNNVDGTDLSSMYPASRNSVIHVMQERWLWEDYECRGKKNKTPSEQITGQCRDAASDALK